MAIPFSTLRFQRVDGEQIWGVDAVRSYPRDVRYHISLYPRDRDDNCYRCQMDKLIGFEGATPGREHRDRPDGLGDRDAVQRGLPDGDFGDMDERVRRRRHRRWGITPNLTFSAAVNPDFSQVEADAFQLDVNRQYALYYEEKRPFFLESSGTFSEFYSAIDRVTRLGCEADRQGRAQRVRRARRARTTSRTSSSRARSGLAGVSLDSESTATAFTYAAGDRGAVRPSTCTTTAAKGTSTTTASRASTLTSGRSTTSSSTSSSRPRRRDYPEAIDRPETRTSTTGSRRMSSRQRYAIRLGHFTSGLDVYANYSEVGEDFRTDLGFMPRVGYKHVGGRRRAHVAAGVGQLVDDAEPRRLLHIRGIPGRDDEPRGTNMWVQLRRAEAVGRQPQRVARQEGVRGRGLRHVGVSTATPASGRAARCSRTSTCRTARRSTTTTRGPGREFAIGPRSNSSWAEHSRHELGHTYERFTSRTEELYTANVSRLKAVYQFSRGCSSGDRAVRRTSEPATRSSTSTRTTSKRKAAE